MCRTFDRRQVTKTPRSSVSVCARVRAYRYRDMYIYIYIYYNTYIYWAWRDYHVKALLSKCMYHIDNSDRSELPQHGGYYFLALRRLRTPNKD